MITTTNTLQLRQNLINSIKETTESTERLSSGKRLNSAADDPSIVGTISRLSSEIASVSQALRNGSNAKSLTQITENGLSEIDNLLSRIKSNNSIHIFGNGGSSSIASHFSMDLTNNSSVKCFSYNDPALITCYSNDFKFENWISRLRKHLQTSTTSAK